MLRDKIEGLQRRSNPEASSCTDSNLVQRGRRLGTEYDTDLRRKVIIYKETWNAWEATQYVPILHRSALKSCALSQVKEDEGAKEPCSSVLKRVV